MKKPLVIDPAVLTRLAGLPKEQRVACQLAIFNLVETFGRPHLHTGLSIRKLRPDLFECRGTIDLRIMFKNLPGQLLVCFFGDHNEIQQALCDGRFG